MINDDINDDRKLIKRKSYSLCNLSYDGQTHMISFVKKNSKSSSFLKQILPSQKLYLPFMTVIPIDIRSINSCKN